MELIAIDVSNARRLARHFTLAQVPTKDRENFPSRIWTNQPSIGSDDPHGNLITFD